MTCTSTICVDYTKWTFSNNLKHSHLYITCCANFKLSKYYWVWTDKRPYRCLCGTRCQTHSQWNPST